MTDHIFFKKGLYIFNPDTDFALASGSKFYTPPASVIALRRAGALTPAHYAPEGSTILLLDQAISRDEAGDSSFNASKIGNKQLHILGVEDLPQYFHDNPELPIFPWGWNPAIINLLQESGASHTLMPTESRMNLIRHLSHRRTTVIANRFLCDIGISHSECMPTELTTLEEGETYQRQHPHAWFKAPWSSSGRGVISSRELYHHETMQWIRGTIRRQGSVMGETPADKILDFATEWFCLRDSAEFAGFSVFDTSSRGKYKKNIQGSRSELENIIQHALHIPVTKIISAQKKLIEQEFVTKYTGPLGIDMMACADGSVRPCVEINLRMTMGHVAVINNS